MCYSLRYNAPSMQPVVNLDDVPPHPGYKPAASSVHYTKSCKQSSAPKDGRNYRPKHVELIGIINILLLLHLVGCLYYYAMLTFQVFAHIHSGKGLFA